MSAAIVRRTDTGFTVSVEVLYKGAMLDAEKAIRQAINEAGVAATAEALSRFDADGDPIRLGPTKFTSMGRVVEEYQTPYGVATVARHVYQSSKGGKTYCPLDQDARIVVSSAPPSGRCWIQFQSAIATRTSTVPEGVLLSGIGPEGGDNDARGQRGKTA